MGSVWWGLDLICLYAIFTTLIKELGMVDNDELDINRQKNVTVVMDADFSQNFYPFFCIKIVFLPAHTCRQE